LSPENSGTLFELFLAGLLNNDWLSLQTLH
jgi:hypothetical protein